MRNSMPRSAGKASFALPTASWIANAQESPSATLGNSANTASTAVLAMRPRYSAILAAATSRHRVSKASVLSSSARIGRLYSATSAARIVVSRRSIRSAIAASPRRAVRVSSASRRSYQISPRHRTRRSLIAIIPDVTGLSANRAGRAGRGGDIAFVAPPPFSWALRRGVDAGASPT